MIREDQKLSLKNYQLQVTFDTLLTFIIASHLSLASSLLISTFSLLFLLAIR